MTIRLFDLQAKTYGEVVTFSYKYLNTVAANKIVAVIIDAERDLRKRYPNIVAIGMAVPGRFRREDGSVYIASTGKGGAREYYPFLEKLKGRVGLPVIMDHDANAGALAYWWFRTNCDTAMSLLFILASEGVGGGVVSEGQIFTGQNRHSSEIGHLIVERRGRICVCSGHGCLDAYGSTLGVERRMMEMLPSYPDSMLASSRKPGIARIFAAMCKGDRLALELIGEAGWYMGLGFASLIPIFDPDLVVVADHMATGGEVLLEGVHKALDENLSPFYTKPDIVLADPEDDLVLLGAATIAIERIFSRPAEFLIDADME